jgi:hemoglobin
LVFGNPSRKLKYLLTWGTPMSLNAFVRRTLRASLVGLSISLVGACSSWIDPSAARVDVPLYQQLGGVDAITQVVSRMLDRVSQDPRSKRTFAGIKMPYLKRSVAAHVCKLADGPCVYEGETMRNAHGDLNISGSEFDLLVQALREELDTAGAPASAKNELLRRLAPLRRDIVKR